MMCQCAACCEAEREMGPVWARMRTGCVRADLIMLDEMARELWRSIIAESAAALRLAAPKFPTLF